MYNTKKVTWRHLKIGQRVECWSVGNTTCCSYATVKEKNAAYFYSLDPVIPRELRPLYLINGAEMPGYSYAPE